MDNDKGPETSGMGCVSWILCDGSKLFKEGLGKIIPTLKKINYHGLMSFRCIINDNKLYGIDFSAGLDNDSIFTILEMSKDRVSDVIYSIAYGSRKNLQFRSEFGISVTFCLLSLPIGICGVEPCVNSPVDGIDSNNIKHIWLYDIYRKEGKYLCAGNNGLLGYVTARGDRIGEWSPIREAKRRAMRTIYNLNITDAVFRDDIGDRVSEDYKTLRKAGWL
jgi:phosphoribosylamine-glycine ligase